MQLREMLSRSGTGEAVCGAQARFGGERRAHVVQAEQRGADHRGTSITLTWARGAASASCVLIPAISSGFQCGTVEQHGSPLVVMERILVDRFIYRGLPRCRRRRAAVRSDRDEPATLRMEPAHCAVLPGDGCGGISGW